MARLTALVALLALPTASAAPLRGPVDVEARRALVGRALPPAAPWTAPPPIRDLDGVSYYTDAHHSVADPALKRKNEAAFAPLRAFVAGIVTLADRWMVGRPADPAIAARAVTALAGWARAGALLGSVNQQGEYEREWTLAGLALAYLRVRDAPGVDAGARASVDRWLVQLAEAVRPNYGHAGRMSSANNHAYWAGLAVAAAGAAAQDRALYDWGLGQARIGLGQIRADGFLPLELERRTLALHYHLFALAPLVMTAELAAANGTDLYKEGDGALRRLADRVIAGLGDPAPFAAAAGAPQEIKLPPRGPELAWAEPYFARFRDRRLAPLLAAARPLRDDRLGGDLTAAFGAPELR
ncbi:MAG TPA: alginate lyase family protein [Polyangia bacterium]|nr:alginate lyase family protein [Polyangia bacterium]